MLDALIIGGGPAGASCALWLARLGHDVIIADAAAEIGGLLRNSPYRNDWIVTQPGVTGVDLAEGIGLSLAAAGVPILLGCPATGATRTAANFEVALGAGDTVRKIAARYLVIATGVRARSGGLPAGENVLIGPGAHVAGQDFSGRRVAILGGGDNAFENYAFAKQCGAAKVGLYARTVRARRALREQVDPADIVQGPYEADADSLCVNGTSYDLFLVMYGWEPRLALADELDLVRNERGYALVDPVSCETSVPDVFAVGEVAARSHPSVVTAMADGIAAAKAIERRLEIS